MLYFKQSNSEDAALRSVPLLSNERIPRYIYTRHTSFRLSRLGYDAYKTSMHTNLKGLK